MWAKQVCPLLRKHAWLAPGMAGDVVVFDPVTIQDRATFTNPMQYPTGIKAVAVNGVVELLDGQRTSQRGGRALRPAT